MDRNRRLLHCPIHCQDDKSFLTSSHGGNGKGLTGLVHFYIMAKTKIAKYTYFDHTREYSAPQINREITLFIALKGNFGLRSVPLPKGLNV